MALAGDFAQLQPVGSKKKNSAKTSLQEFIEGLRTITLKPHEFARSKDPVLLDFLTSIRLAQPRKRAIKEFFKDRHLKLSLEKAIERSIQLESLNHKPVTWLTVTNAGSAKVNEAMLSKRCGLTPDFIQANGYAGDTKAGADRLIIQVGMRLRLTRNLDKDRGFVNGAIGWVVQILNKEATVFTMKLTHGSMVLVHPIHADGKTFLPCAYGYAMTIRPALSTFHKHNTA